MIFNAKKKDLISTFIVGIISISVIFFESILILFKGLKRGFMKKEVLSKNSKLGFDLDIIIK